MPAIWMSMEMQAIRMVRSPGDSQLVTSQAATMGTALVAEGSERPRLATLVYKVMGDAERRIEVGTYPSVRRGRWITT